MFKQTPKSRVLFAHRFMPVLLVLFGVFSLAFANFHVTPVATAATADTVNFQARLQSSAGAVVPDGTYNVEFKLYDIATSSGSSQGACSGDAHCLWTETRTSTNKVTVKNGYLSVSLGSVNAFSGIKWDQKLWLTMNIGGTGSASWDGEMNPRLPLTAVPYAFSAGQLQTSNGSLTSTLSIQAPTVGNQVFQIQDQGAAGTYNLLTTAQANANYIQLQGSLPGSLQTGNFNISGTGAAAIVQGGQIKGGSSQQFTVDTNGNVVTSGTATIKTDSSSAFNIQNAAGTQSILNVDTTKSTLTLTAAQDSTFTASSLGPELITTTDFTNPAWVEEGYGGDWTLSTSNATYSGDYDEIYSDQFASTVGESYQVIFTVSGGTSDTAVDAYVGGKYNETVRGNGTFTQYITATDTTGVRFGVYPWNDVTTTATISNVSVKKVLTFAQNDKPVLVVKNSQGATNLELRTGATDSIYIGLNAGVTGGGDHNIGFGTEALKANTSGSYNTGTGAFVLQGNTTGSYNTAYGAYALQGNVDGLRNTAVGAQSLQSNTSGSDNAAIGAQALQSNTSGNGNTAIGSQSLQSNTTGALNIAIGNYTLQANTTGYSNSAVGAQALLYNTTGALNTAIGNAALENNTIGGSNTAIGNFALLSNDTGSGNTAIGNMAMLLNVTGEQNTAIGQFALQGNTSGLYNVAIGDSAGAYNTGSGSVFLGYQAGINETGSNKLYIANSSTNTPLIQGDFAAQTLNFNGTVGLGTASALNGRIDFYNATNTNTATIISGATTASYTTVLPTELGTAGQCLAVSSVADTTQTLGYADCGGSGGGSGGSFVNLQDATPGTAQTGNLNITGTAMVGTAVLTPSIDALSSGALTIGGTNATNISLQDDTVLAADKSITITGSGVRPLSPSEGMLYYDTNIKALIVYANGRWQSYAGNTTTKIVGTSASGGTSGAVASQNPDGANFVNTSTTSAQTTINNALASLPATGGSVYLMEGTYIIDGSINVPNNTTLVGAGPGTVIKFKNSMGAGTFSAITNAVTFTGTSITIRDLAIDGNRSNNTTGSPTLDGIYIYNFSGGSGASALAGAKISNVYASNLSGAGVYSSFSNNVSVNNVTSLNNDAGLKSHQSYNNVWTNNIVQGNTSFGIYISYSNNNVFNDNIVQADAIGYYVAGSSHNTFSGNNINGNDYNALELVAGSNENTISGNRISDNGGSFYNRAMNINASSRNTIVGNTISDTSASVENFAINVENNTSANNYMANNTLGSGSISDAGTGTIYSNQLDANGNLINRNQGAMTIGTTSANATLSLQGGLKTTQLTAPTISSVTNTGTTGSTTYRYQVTAYDGNGETLPSTLVQTTSGNATLTSGNYNTVTWAQISGAYQYKIYRCTGSGCTPALLATVAGNVLSYNDQANGSPSGVLPTANTTGSGSFAGSLQAASFDATAASAMTIGATNATAINLGNTGSNIQTTVNGTFLVKPTGGNDSATAFVVQRAAGTDTLLTANTVNNRIKIGNDTASTGGDVTLLVLDNATSSNVPTGLAGAMYYDSTNNKFKCYTTSWVDCDTTGGSGGSSSKRMTFTPEYAGGVLKADGTNNNGTMTSDFVNGLTSGEGYKHNYYEWTSSQSTSQDYDIYVNHQLPSDFNATTEFDASTWKIWTYSDNLTNTSMTMTVYDSDGTACASGVNVQHASSTGWQQITLADFDTNASCDFTANDNITVKISVAAKSSAKVRIGEFQYNYTN